jgi:CoA-transferase family III
VRSFALPANVLSRAERLATAIEQRIAVRVDVTELITGRAALSGLHPPTRISSGGATRLLEAADGWCALTLSRPVDLEAVPAFLERSEVADPWEALCLAAAGRRASEFVARARLLDLPAAVLGEVAATEPTITSHNPSSTACPISELFVVDLSPMWAGPLCGRILAAAGATVVKAEAPNRPDGARAGEQRFFDWMNAGKLCYTDDFAELLRAADVVIEASRPAALTRRGLGAEQVPARPGRVWLRISGYGRAYPDRVAFGDDAAVAGGLVMNTDDGPVFCGDAIADPLTGLEATAAVLNALEAGGGMIIDLSMAAVAATYAALPDKGIVRCRPRLPQLPARPAHQLGADTARVRELVRARLVAC